MKTMKTTLFVTIILALLLAGCAAPAAAPTEEAMMEKPTEAAMMDKPTEEAMMEKPTEDAMMEKPTEEAMMDKPTEAAMMEKPTEAAMMAEEPAWFKAELTDVRSGETFTVADYHGKVVLVETMAIWCTTCFRQQGEVLALHTALGENDDFVSLVLDIDPSEAAADLKGYAEANGFAGRYVVAPREVASEIANLYGNNFLNPPSAPMFIIARDGSVHPLPFGVKSAADLQAALEPFLSAQ